MTITRDWRADTLVVHVEHEPLTVDDDQGDAIIRAAGDFEIREVEFRLTSEIQSGS